MKSCKRSIAFLLSLLMLLSVVPLAVTAASVTSETVANSNLIWKQDFESAKTIKDALKTVNAAGVKLSTSATDSQNRVVQLDLTGIAPSAYYLVHYNDKKYVALKDYTLSDDGKSLSVASASVNGATYTNVSGTINDQKFSTVAKQNGTDISGVYICTGALTDAYISISHAAKTNYFANPAVKNENVDAFVIDMKFFFSEGAKATQHFTMYMSGTKVSDNSAVGLALLWLAPNGSTLKMEKVDRQAYVDGNEVTMTLGDWHHITLVIDKNTAQIEYYVDGEYAYTTRNNSTGVHAEINAPINLTENSVYFQLNRLHTMENLNGYVQIDDVSFYSSTDGLGLTKNKPVWRQDFETATTVTSAFKKAEAIGLSLTSSVTDPTDRVIQWELKGMAPSAYYLVDKANKKYGALSGYTLSADGKTMTGGTAKVGSTTYSNVQGTINTDGYDSLAMDANGNDISSFYICTGELADAYVIVANTAKPATFDYSAVNNADVEDFVLEMSIYLPEGAKAEKTINSHISGTRVDNGSAVSIALFALVPNGETAKLQVTDKSTYVRGGAVTLPLGEWFRFTFVIDKETSVVDVYVNGHYKYTARNNNSGSLAEINGAVNLTADAWSLQFNRLGLPSQMAKYFQLDDIAIYTSTKDRGLYMREDFEGHSSNIGKKPALGVSVHDLATYATDPLNADNVAVKIPFGAEPNNTEILMIMEGAYPKEKAYYTVTRNTETNAVEVAGYTVTPEAGGTYTLSDGTNTYTGLKLATMQDYCSFWGGDGTVDQNWRLNHFAVSPDSHSRVTLSARYYLSADASGSFMGQLHSYKNNGTNASFLILYTVDAAKGTIKLGAATTTYQVMKKGDWNVVMASIDPVSGDIALYVNGSLIASTSLGVTNLTFNTDSWSFCKIVRRDKPNYGKYAGYVLVDDVQIRCEKASHIAFDPNGLLYVEVDGAKVYGGNKLYLPYGTEYNAVYFDLSDYEGMLTTEDKNSIRISSSAGLRYATQIDTDKLDALFDMLDSGFFADVSFGTMIAPTDYITTEFTIDAFDKAGKRYVLVEANRGKYYEFDEAADTTHFVGSIVNFYEANISRAFSGRGYVTVTLHNGQIMTIYSGFTKSADVQTVATKALNCDQTWSDVQKNILELFAAGKQPPLSERAQQIQDLAKLNVLAIGDSHMKGSATQWVTLLAQQSNWNLTNLGVSGWTVAYNPGAYPEGERVRGSMYDYLYNKSGYVYGSTSSSYYTYGDTTGKTAADVDLIFFDGGWNDFMWGIPLGTVDSTDGSTLQGARNLIIQKLLVDYPNATIILISEWDVDSVRADGAHRVDFVSDGLKNLYEAKYASNARVKLIDAGDPAVSGVNMADKAWKEAYGPDGVHINEEGMKIFAENILPYVWKEYLNK